jgi:hypothetical protein
MAVFITFFASAYFFRGSGVTLPKIAADLNGMHLYSWAISLPAPEILTGQKDRDFG